MCPLHGPIPRLTLLRIQAFQTRTIVVPRTHRSRSIFLLPLVSASRFRMRAGCRRPRPSCSRGTRPRSPHRTCVTRRRERPQHHRPLAPRRVRRLRASIRRTGTATLRGSWSVASRRGRGRSARTRNVIWRWRASSTARSTGNICDTLPTTQTCEEPWVQAAYHADLIGHLCSRVTMLHFPTSLAIPSHKLM